MSSFHERLFSSIPNTEKELKITNENDTHLGGWNKKEEENINKKLCSGFESILQTLKNNPEDIHQRIDRLKNLSDHESILKKISHFISETEWEMLAVLEAYDKPTFDHSLRVTNFIYTLTTENNRTQQYLQKRIEIEESSFDKLYLASLFHDIGKTAIPRHILHDNHSRREWGKRANKWAKTNNKENYFDAKKLETLDEVELDHYFMQIHTLNKYDPLNIVPIKNFFNEQDLHILKQHSISPNDTFRKVLECHEKATESILLSKQMYITADIASHHHDYERKPIQLERYKTEISALRLGFELSILRSMDVFDALTSDDRSYKTPYHPLLALKTLIKEAEAGFTEPELTKYIVSDLYAKIKERNPTTQAEKIAQKKILDFIA